MNMKLIMILTCMFGGIQGIFAQNSADQIPTGEGDLKVQPVMHASLVLNWGDKNVYVDPTGSVEAYKAHGTPDVILITDIHGDHMDPRAITALHTENTIIVAPQAVADALPVTVKKNLVVLKNGESSNQLGMTIRAVPMYNLPETADSRHIKGRGNGYVLSIGGKNVYISGDTEDIPEMRALKNIDIAFVCMNLPYTMDINQAASGVLAFEPKIVYPYHHRGQDVSEFKKLVDAGNKPIEVRLRNWYPQ